MLKNIEFINIKYQDTVVNVITKEVWDIKHIDLKTQKVIKDHKGYQYEIDYRIIKQNDKWLIDDAEVINEKVP